MQLLDIDTKHTFNQPLCYRSEHKACSIACSLIFFSLALQTLATPIFSCKNQAPKVLRGIEKKKIRKILLDSFDYCQFLHI